LEKLLGRAATENFYILDELTRGLLCHWWEIAKTVYPNFKDVKKHGIDVREFEDHPIHYL
jgi:hypothetical protein